MDKKIITKVTAAFLAFILTFANVILLGIYTQEVHAASIELEEQTTAINKTKVEFDAYFLDEGRNIHSKEIDIRENSDKLYLNLKVLEGYLTNGIVKIENANFKLVETDETLEFIQSIDVETNTITLNQIDKNESVVLEIPIKMNTDFSFAVENFNKVAKVTLEGTYINSKSKEIEVSKTIEVVANIKAEATANLEQEISKYVRFNENGNKGLILQSFIKSNIADNILPIKQTEIEIEIPKINNKEPKKVILSSISTESTNGKSENIFTSEDYTYENGKIKLIVENIPREDGTISWIKNTQDEILLTCIYGEEAIIENESVDITLKADSEITPYNNEETKIVGTFEEKITLEEEIGKITTFDMEISNTKFEKGQMLVEGAENTKYTQVLSVNIGNQELVDGIILEDKMNYLDESRNEYPSNPIYTYTKISRENFIEILGEEGQINIYNKEGKVIATLDKDNLEYQYEDTETTYIKVETSKIQKEGILKIENGREIKSAEYEKEQTVMFKQMEATMTGSVISNEKISQTEEISKQINLEEPKTAIEVQISKTNLSTVETNEKVELRVVLDTNDGSKSLYKNPKISIEFPSYIEGITEGKIALLYEKELKLGSTSTYRNESGNIVVQAQMIGEQTAFNTSSVSKGATLILSANLNVNEITPAIEDNIKVYISNENETVYEKEENGMGKNEIDIQYAAQNKVITRSTISGYNENEEVKALEEAEVATINAKSETKNAKVKLDVVNSTSKDITNVSILGRTPFEGNKSVVSGEDLNSKFTANMISTISETYGINKENIKIYYSNNGEATKDLANKQNGWMENPEDMSGIKSYLIDLGESIIKFGDRLTFEYNIQIPENLGNAVRNI